MQYLLIKCLRSFTLLLGILHFRVAGICWLLLACILPLSLNAHAARLAIVIDDVGYRVHNEKKYYKCHLQFRLQYCLILPMAEKWRKKLTNKAGKF